VNNGKRRSKKEESNNSSSSENYEYMNYEKMGSKKRMTREGKQKGNINL